MGTLCIHLLWWILLIYSVLQASVLMVCAIWIIWSELIRPRFIPAAEIERMAADIIARYDNPEAEALARSHRAWMRSDSAGQLVWSRVRKSIRKNRSCKLPPD